MAEQLPRSRAARGCRSRWIIRPPRADEDLLLRVGLDVDGRAHDLLAHLLHLDRDRVRHLVARQRERLLAHELGDLHLGRSGRCAAPAGSTPAPRAAARRAPRAARRRRRRCARSRDGPRGSRPSLAAFCSCCAMWPGLSRSTLFSAITTGTPRPKTRFAMKRSPAPIRSRASRTSSTPSTSSNDESTVRCMCSVSGSRGRWKPGRSASASCQSSPFATPKMRRRVVCGLSETIATLPPQSAFTSVDLPTFGPPGDGDDARPHRTNESGSSSAGVTVTTSPLPRR